MAKEAVTLQEAITLARQLGPMDRSRLRRALDQMDSAPNEENPEITFKRNLLEKGLIGEIRLVSHLSELRVGRRLVAVKGKPVSQTIVEDRG